MTENQVDLDATITELEEAFLDASVRVWREIDRLTEAGETLGSPTLAPPSDLRIRERAAWEAYRDKLGRLEANYQELSGGAS